MNVLTRFSLAILLYAFNSFSVYAQKEQHISARHASFLRNLDTASIQAMLKGKPGLIAGYWAEDIRLMPEYQKTIIGKTNAAQYRNAFVSRFDVLEYSRNKSEILDLDSRILALGTFTMEVRIKANSQEYRINGNYCNIWIKQGNESPLLITEAWNYSKQVECAQYLVFGEVPSVNIALEAHVPVNSNISFELAAINTLTEEFITQHDDYLWSQLYASDAKLIYSNHPIYNGKKEINAFLKEHVKVLPVFEKLDIRTDRIDHLGTLLSSTPAILRL